MNSREDLKAIPSVDEAIRHLESADLLGDRPRPLVVRAVRAALEEERREILAGRRGTPPGADDPRERILRRLEGVPTRLDQRELQPVVNATGIIVHTNLGRAPLSEEALAAVSGVSRGYTNLEYDLAAGKRGKRHIIVKDALCELCGVEDALVVNNNAAAVLLALNTLAAGREVVVSRSELIEIGGSFRLPEVFEKSGSKMVEVGTTNRTHIEDFERAIRGRTGAIMSAHWSNYEIVGFVERVSLSDLAALGARYGIPLIHDLGSGVLTDASALGLPGEMTVMDSVRAGTTVSTFSGDKLLGGPQAGIAVGGAEVIGKMRENPLMRALRPGKLTLAALAVTLGHYLRNEAHAKIPVLAMITGSLEELAGRARAMVEELNGRLAGRASARRRRDQDARIIAARRCAHAGGPHRRRSPDRSSQRGRARRRSSCGGNQRTMSTPNGTQGEAAYGAALERLRDTGLFVDGLSLPLANPQKGPALVRPIVGDAMYDWLPAFETAVRPEAGSRIAVTSRDPRLAARVACDAAAWIADRGSEVVLVDGSVLSPSIGKALLEDGDEGLVDAVSFGVSPSYVARRTLATGVRLITTGSHPLSVDQVFRSDSFGKTLAGLGNVVVLVVLPEDLLDLAVGWLTTVVAVGEDTQELEALARGLADESGTIRPRTVAVVIRGIGVDAVDVGLPSAGARPDEAPGLPTGSDEHLDRPAQVAEERTREPAWAPEEEPGESEPKPEAMEPASDAQSEWPPWDDTPALGSDAGPADTEATADAPPPGEEPAPRVYEIPAPTAARADADADGSAAEFDEDAEADSAADKIAQEPVERADADDSAARGAQKRAEQARPAGAPQRVRDPEESEAESVDQEPEVAKETPVPRVVVTGATTRRPKRRHGVHVLIALLALVPVIALIAWRVSTSPNASWRFWEREESVVTAPAGKGTGKAAGKRPARERQGKADAGKAAGALAEGEGQEQVGEGAPGETDAPGDEVAAGAKAPVEEPPSGTRLDPVPPDAGQQPPATPITGPGGSYVIFVSSHKHESAAAREAAMLASQGYASRVVATELPEQGTWHRVAVDGGFPSAGAAREVLDAVKRLGYQGAWVQRVSRNR